MMDKLVKGMGFSDNSDSSLQGQTVWIAMFPLAKGNSDCCKTFYFVMKLNEQHSFTLSGSELILFHSTLHQQNIAGFAVRWTDGRTAAPPGAAELKTGELIVEGGASSIITTGHRCLIVGGLLLMLLRP